MRPAQKKHTRHRQDNITPNTDHLPMCSVPNTAQHPGSFCWRISLQERLRLPWACSTLPFSLLRSAPAQAAAKHANVCAHQHPEWEEETIKAAKDRRRGERDITEPQPERHSELVGWPWLKCPFWLVNKPPCLFVFQPVPQRDSTLCWKQSSETSSRGRVEHSSSWKLGVSYF